MRRATAIILVLFLGCATQGRDSDAGNDEEIRTQCWSNADCERMDVPPCKQATCNFQSGQCEFKPDFAQDGRPCDDHNQCTLGDRCVSGFCAGQDFRDCDDHNDCTRDRCDYQTGCIHTPMNNGQSCDDHNPCTKDDKCESGRCVGRDGTCMCQDDADCVAFEDSNLCNGLLICDPVKHSCVIDPDSVVRCKQPDDLCEHAKCDPTTGNCVITPAKDHAACDDFDPCTTGDQCIDGRCQGTPKCSDNNPCTIDKCDPVTGACSYDPTPLNGQPCDQGQCVDGVCRQIVHDVMQHDETEEYFEPDSFEAED